VRRILQPIKQHGKSTSGFKPSFVLPDGRFVSCLYLDDHEGKKDWKIAIVPFDGGLPVKLFDFRPTPLGFAPLPLTSDGKALMYLDRKGGVSNIWRLTIANGQSRQLTNFGADQIFYFDLSKNGTQTGCRPRQG